MACCRMKRCRWLRSTDSGVGRQTISLAGEKGFVIFEGSCGSEPCSILGDQSHGAGAHPSDSVVKSEERSCACRASSRGTTLPLEQLWPEAQETKLRQKQTRPRRLRQPGRASHREPS